MGLTEKDNESKEKDLWVIAVQADADNALGTDVEESVLTKVNSENVQKSIKETLEIVSTTVESIPDNHKKFVLDEFEVKLQITAEGSVAILGTGVGLGCEGGLTFTFKRKNR